MTWLTIKVTRSGAEYDLEIKDPPVNRNFCSKASLLEYIATRFTMGLVEAQIYMTDIEAGITVFSLPTLPENFDKL